MAFSPYLTMCLGALRFMLVTYSLPLKDLPALCL